ncbi:hypothetical protein GQ53DRAFT_67408 [Thozetella sp. PMI_491]|nr:hypothetical protein GQ53DRAFT_67408 [Thozetella sp. PMI_491]
MAPTIASAEQTLTYPLYGCEFDPQDANRLIVAGGGGEGRSGVGNKISLLDVTQPDAIATSSELELSRDEDNPTTLAVGLRKGKATLVYAGINSGEESIKKGKNEHFRVFGVDQPSKANAVIGPRIGELSRSSLFASSDIGAYQRLLRIAPSVEGSTHQLGAIATGFAKEHEIIIFDVSPAGSPAPKRRGRLELPKEAMDLDIIQTGDEHWQLVYCDDHELHLMELSSKGADSPELIYTIPHDDTYNVRPKFRLIRYLTPNFLLAAVNIPNGVILYGLRLPKPGVAGGKARVAVSKKLPKLFTRSVALAVRNLAPPTTLGARQGDTQFVVAVASNEGAIILYALELQTMSDIDLLSGLNEIATLKDVHDGPITGLNFSYFTPPKGTTMRQLRLRLASVGTVGNKVAVHTIPLKKLLDKAPATKKGGPPRHARYVVALKIQGTNPAAVLITLAVAIAIMGILAQLFFELKGISRPIIGAHKIAPASWVRPIREAPAGILTEAVAGVIGNDAKVVVLDRGDGAIKVDVHDEDQHGEAMNWEELPKIQKEAWKEKLKEAGHWGEEMGETILKSLFFGEIAGLVEGVVRG